MLDEGFNRTCHTPEFEDHLASVLKERGEELGAPAGEKRSYDGIGTCTTLGRRSIPFSLKLGKSGTAVKAELMSNKLSKGAERLWLLSLKAQATLGICKDVRDGSCYMKDYKESVQLVEVKGSELRAICISDSDLPNAEVGPGDAST